MLEALERDSIFYEVLYLKSDKRKAAIAFGGLQAFKTHLELLGEKQNISPSITEGRNQIAIPAFFQLSKFEKNPLNAGALALLPKYDYRSAYGNSIDTIVHDQKLTMALHMPDSGIVAARAGNAVDFIIAHSLRLNESSVPDTELPSKTLASVKDLVGDITRDIDSRVVGSIEEVAELVSTGGYEDFFDYLMDVRSQIDQRVETIFRYGPNHGEIKHIEQ